MRLLRGGLAAIAILLAMPSPLLLGQEERGAASIVEVRVEGNQTIADETVLAKVQSKPGRPLSQATLDEDLKRLFATGYFEDATIETLPQPDGVVVVFHVKEKPTVTQVLVEGHRRLRRDKIIKLVEVKPGELYDANKLKRSQTAVLDAYHKKGYTQTNIATDVKVNPATNEATVYFLIDEGQRLKIKRIDVEGNRSFTDRRIRKLMRTKRATLIASGAYNEEQLQEDLERIAAYYRREGFQDVRVAHELAQDPAKGRLYLTIKMTEGEQYFVREIKLAGPALFPEVELRHALEMQPGAVFSQDILREDVQRLQGYYFDRGYIFAEVQPDTSMDTAAKQVDILYAIKENELAYIDRIDVRGNTKTKDVVIRRELRVKPGDAFDGASLKRSRERLTNLGYFEEIAFDHEPGSTPTHRNLVVNVKETKTGSFSFGGGFSSVDKLLGFVEVEQRNFDWRNWPYFTGAGQDLRLRAEIGSVRQNFELSFTEPWIFNRPLSFGFDLFHRSLDRENSLGLAYDEQRVGGDLRFGKEFTEYVSGNVLYGLEQVTISDVVAEASQALKDEEGENFVSRVGTTLTYDSRDNRFDTTRGHVFSGNAELAGGFLAGDKDFTKFIFTASRYQPLGRRWVMELRSRLGVVDAYGDSKEVPIFERFFAGGSNTIRGFRERRVGPRDPSSNDPIGGESMLIGNLELVYPIIEQLKAAVFVDAGNVWRRVTDLGESYRVGAGIGARVKTPIGPIRLDLGIPVKKEPDEKRSVRFHFNISRGF